MKTTLWPPGSWHGTIYLKPEYKSITLTSEQKSGLTMVRDATAALAAIGQYFAQTYHTGSSTAENRTQLEAADYLFTEDIVD